MKFKPGDKVQLAHAEGFAKNRKWYPKMGIVCTLAKIDGSYYLREDPHGYEWSSSRFKAAGKERNLPEWW